MTNRIDREIDDINALIVDMEKHQRRKRMEREFGPIAITCHWPPIPLRNFDYEAYFERYCDLDMPVWARGFGPTEAEALDDLLTQAEQKFLERYDEARLAELERRSDC